MVVFRCNNDKRYKKTKAKQILINNITIRVVTPTEGWLICTNDWILGMDCNFEQNYYYYNNIQQYYLFMFII